MTAEFWIDNSVEVDMPLDALDAIVALPSVEGVFPDAEVVNNAWYDGESITDALQTEIYSDNGYYGESNGRYTDSSDNIKVGLTEFNKGGPNLSHVGWRDAPGGVSRVKSSKYCSSSSCTVQINLGTDNHNHSSAAVLAGSIEQGQDPSYPSGSPYSSTGTDAQRQRSGVVQEAEVFMFTSASGFAGIKKAIEELVNAGVDVISMSASSTENPCTWNFDPASVSTAILGAKNAGVPVFVGTGNRGGGTCSVEFPAYLPYVISVGALATNDNSTAYGTTARWTNSGFGRMAVTGGNGSTVYVPAVSVMTPGYIAGVLKSGTSRYVDGADAYGWYSGTSAATPVAAGVGALSLEWMRDNFIPTSPRTVEVIHATIGVFGDGAISSTSKTRTYVDDEYGYGRLKAQLPLPSPAGQGAIADSAIVWKHGTISSGQVIRWSAGFYPGTRKGLKSALIVDDPGNNNWNVPNFRFRIVDACNGYAVLKEASANDFLKKRIRVYDTSKLVTGICPYVEIELLDSGFTNVEYAATTYIFGGYAGTSDPWDYH